MPNDSCFVSASADCFKFQLCDTIKKTLKCYMYREKYNYQSNMATPIMAVGLTNYHTSNTLSSTVALLGYKVASKNKYHNMQHILINWLLLKGHFIKKY